MNINSINKTSFGWNKTTHLEMTMLALKDINLDAAEKRQLARYSQMPDFSKNELGFFHNAHFFFPDSKHGTYGKNSGENAFQRFNFHVINALSPIDKEDFLRHTGYAVHYLEDVSMPMHTESGGLLQKMRDYYLHKNFETGKKYGATAHINELKSNYIPHIVEAESVRRIFLDTAEFSSKFKISRFNKKEWQKIRQACFNAGTDSVTAFIKSMLKKFNF